MVLGKDGRYEVENKGGLGAIETVKGLRDSDQGKKGFGREPERNDKERFGGMSRSSRGITMEAGS